MKLKDVERRAQCEACKSVVTGDGIMLWPWPKNISVPFGCSSRFVFVDIDGVIRSSTTTNEILDTDSIMACPFCGTVHPFGFDPLEEQKEE